MKLTTRQGDLDLPQDFTITLERHNPLLSGEGDSSVPVTLPSSTRNLAATGHRERIDRATRFTNKVDAILQAGPVQKRGQLVIDTVHRQNGIDAVFAFDNSDLYATSKDKSLKKIFESLKEEFPSVQDAIDRMQQVYEGNEKFDYKVFPVAVSKYEEEGVEVYQYNNEDPGTGTLVSEQRIVREGNVNMLVPEGYGIAPYLKLQRLLDRLFECLGYSVATNFFNQAPFYSQICIVHNCADCLVTPVLHYSDLVPSCTLGEFLDWLLAKFHVQPLVDSESKLVHIVRMTDKLNSIVGNYDLDLTGTLDGDFQVQLNPSKRVVLQPTWEIEGTEPAAETFDKLLEKYGSYVEAGEKEFITLEGDSPSFNDCLVLRKATGQFYLLEREIPSGKQVLHRLGSNHFTYDRKNSDETEEYQQNDLIPLMICGHRAKKDVAPYIGDRIHRHTSYNNSADDSEQKIIVVQANTGSNHNYKTTATTQRCIPAEASNTEYTFWFGLDNHSLYGGFWDLYNRVLLNNPVHLKGRLKLDIATLLSMDMSTLKLMDGQRLIPVSLSVQLADKPGMTEAEFILFKHFSGSVAEEQPQPAEANLLKWQMDTTDLDRQALSIYMSRIYVAGRNTYLGYSVQPLDMDKVWLGTPSYPGETRTLTTMVNFTIKVKEMVTIGGATLYYNREYRIDGHYDDNGNLLDNNGVPWTWLQDEASFIFTAVTQQHVVITNN